MRENLKSVAFKIDGLNLQIASGDIQKAEQEWGGADVAIIPAVPERRPGGFYPEPRYVVTPFALELSWLFEKLRDAFGNALDGMNKIEFYGRLANAANRYLKHAPAQNDPKGLLDAVLREAAAMHDEMEEGRFVVLPIAEGNTIWDDIVEEAERSGYLGPEQTLELLRSLDIKHNDA